MVHGLRHLAKNFAKHRWTPLVRVQLDNQVHSQGPPCQEPIVQLLRSLPADNTLEP